MAMTLILGCLLSLTHTSRAAVIYSGIQDIPIPTTFEGVYVDLDNAGSGNSVATVPGWDINPFFGGIGIAGSANFQPSRLTASNDSQILKLAVDDTVNGGHTYSTGETGSSDHFGTAPEQFHDGVEAYIGFRFVKNDTSGPFYGWMRVTLTANTPGAVISDWAWEDGGGDILVGAVPEPSTLMLGALGFLALLWRR